MKQTSTARRDFLKQTGLFGSAAMMAGLPQAALAFSADPAHIIEDAVVPQAAEEAPKNHIKFAVCGMSHDHIYGMIGAIQRGGGELVAAWVGEPDKLALFTQALPRRKGRQNPGRNPQRPIHSTRAQLANRQ
jgi:hypothetical protein